MVEARQKTIKNKHAECDICGKDFWISYPLYKSYCPFCKSLKIRLISKLYWTKMNFNKNNE